MTVTKVHTHDSFIKKTMSQINVAREFFESMLPKSVLCALDLSTLKQEKTTFLDNTLGHGVVDLLYSAKFGQDKGYISILLEHQATSDHTMPFRIQKYCLMICGEHLKKHPKAKLPLIYPMILYTGKDKYTAPLSFWEMFGNPKLARSFLTDSVQLLELRSMKNIDLEQRYYAGSVLYIMSKIYEKDIMMHLNFLYRILKTIGNENFKFIEDMLSYILGNSVEEQVDPVVTFFKKTVSPDKSEDIMTLADQLIARGIAQGMQQGMQQQQLFTAMNLLKRGMVAQEVSEITGLPYEAIIDIKVQN